MSVDPERSESDVSEEDEIPVKSDEECSVCLDPDTAWNDDEEEENECPEKASWSQIQEFLKNIDARPEEETDCTFDNELIHFCEKRLVGKVDRVIKPNGKRLTEEEHQELLEIWTIAVRHMFTSVLRRRPVEDPEKVSKRQRTE